MGKTSEVRSDGAGAETRGPGAPESGSLDQRPSDQNVRKRSEHQVDGQRAGRRRADAGAGADDGVDAAEHLQQDFAKVRAKVAIDPVLAARSFSAAWTTDVIEEEDEAEFVDAVADCLGAGFSLESALTGWDNGTLAADSGEESSLFDDESEREEESPALSARHTPSGGRRIVMT